MDKSEEKESLVSFILSIRALSPAETVNGMRWCNPRAHMQHAHTRSLPLSPSLFSFLHSFSLSLSLAFSCLPASSTARSEKWNRWARGDGATPSPLLFCSRPPRCSITRATTHNTDQGMVQRTPYREDLSVSLPPCLHMHIHTQRGELYAKIKDSLYIKQKHHQYLKYSRIGTHCN